MNRSSSEDRRYLGATMSDVPAQYREHAALVADGARPRPTRSLLMEFDSKGEPRIYAFGPDFSHNRDAMSALLNVLTILNANASN